MYSAEGEWLGEFGSEGSGPGEFLILAGLAIDAFGRLFVADAGNGRIQLLQPNLYQAVCVGALA